MQNTHQCFF